MTATVDTLAGEWVQHRVRAGLIRPKSGRRQRYQLVRFRDAHGVDRTMRADRRVFDRWLETIGHLTANTRRGHASTVRSFVVWAASEGHIAPRALAYIPKVRNTRSVPRALNGDQVAQLLRSLATPKQRVIVGLMLWAGLRCGEVAGLRVEDVDELDATVLVIGKGGNERVLCIPAELAPYVSEWLNMRRRVPGPFLRTRTGGHYESSSVSRLVARWMADAGVKHFAHDGRSAHALRHTAASDVLEGGALITTVQQMLGHAHLATTATYLRRAKLEDLRKAMEGRHYVA